MTAADPADTVPNSMEDQTREAVSCAIARLLRSQPAPSGPGVDDVQRAAWFTRRAALLDQIASAAAHPWPAVEAACLARQARHTGRACTDHPHPSSHADPARRRDLPVINLPDETSATETAAHPGPETPAVTPAGYARAAAEAIRGLNHATLGSGGYVWPADVDAVVAELETMVERLPQAFAQAQGWLLAARDAGRVGQDPETADGPVDVDEAISIAWNHLRQASTYATWTRDALHLARTETCHLTVPAPDPTGGGAVSDADVEGAR